MNQKAFYTLLIFMAGILLFIRCGREKEALEKYFENYHTWNRPYTEVLDYPVPGHGDTFRVIYANNITFNPDTGTMGHGSSSIVMKEGSVIVKEVYVTREAVGKKEPTLTCMIKKSKDSRSLRGWIYVMKEPGKKAVAVTGRMCIGCHVAANEEHPYFDGNKKAAFRDYLFVPFTSKK